MGKLKNIVSATISGNVGSMTFRRRGADTVVAIRTYENRSRGEGATEEQRLHRSRMANVVSFYRAVKPIQARAWEDKRGYTTDYNAFFSSNLASSPILLTKQEVSFRACVIAPYIVSRGSLQTLAQRYAAGSLLLGVVCDPALDFSTATVGEVSASIIALNAGWIDGDKLTICCISQSRALRNGLYIPTVRPHFLNFTLNTSSMSLISALPGANELAFGHNADGELCCGQAFDCGFAIHSRELDGGLLTSGQQVVFRSFQNEVYLQYTSQAQLEAAMQSYGYQKDVLLTPHREESGRVSYPAEVTAFLFNGEPLANGAEITEEGSLEIHGSYLSASRVEVRLENDALTPSVLTQSLASFSLTENGGYTIWVNGILIMTFYVNYNNIEVYQMVNPSMGGTRIRDTYSFIPDGLGNAFIDGYNDVSAYWILDSNIKTLLGHKYLFYLKNQVSGLFLFNSGTGYVSTSTVNPNIAEARDNQPLYISLRPGYTINGVTVTPQAFDLTSMFGAGNEPATPDEFAQRLGYASFAELPYFPYNPGPAAAAARMVSSPGASFMNEDPAEEETLENI